MAVLHAVANALECPICFEEFREPKTLSCKHSFCRRCLAKLLQLKYVKRDGSLQAPRKTTAIVCPTCNTSEVFHSLDDIGTFHVINNLLEAQVKERGETQEESFRCVCTKMAKICCYRCNDCFCLGCYEKAKRELCTIENDDFADFTQNGVMRHKFVSITTLSEDDCDCAEHSLPLDLFCGDCKVAICIDCFLLSHGDHQTKLVKHVREEALTLVEKIKSIRKSNTERHHDLHQVACNESKDALEDKQRIHARIEDSERRVHKLVSTLFKKARSLCSCKSDIRVTTAEETMSFCDSSSLTCSDHDFNDKTDFELACLMSDLQVAENRVQTEATNIERKLQSVERTKSENSIELHINEEPIFNCILSIFKHFYYGEENLAKDLAQCSSLEEFSEGKCSNKTEAQKVRSAPDSALGIQGENQHTSVSNQQPHFSVPHHQNAGNRLQQAAVAQYHPPKYTPPVQFYRPVFDEVRLSPTAIRYAPSPGQPGGLHHQNAGNRLQQAAVAQYHPPKYTPPVQFYRPVFDEVRLSPTAIRYAPSPGQPGGLQTSPFRNIGPPQERLRLSRSAVAGSFRKPATGTRAITVTGDDVRPTTHDVRDKFTGEVSVMQTRRKQPEYRTKRGGKKERKESRRKCENQYRALTNKRQSITEQLSPSSLATVSPQQQKQMIRERLFPMVQEYELHLAGKVTGMLLELDNSTLLRMLESRESLRTNVEDAVQALKALQAKEAQSSGHDSTSSNVTKS